MAKTDKIFSTPLPEIKGFCFNEQVAEVFDDMVSRSIPFYDEIHRIILDIASRLDLDHKTIYDIGCSTGTTISILNKFLKSKHIEANFVGIDSSGPMLKKAQEKLEKNGTTNASLRLGLAQDQAINQAALVVMNYTLQFVPTADRQALVNKIYQALEPQGAFIYAEKIKCDDRVVDDLLIDLYYDFKRRNGYSELEIAQKREALENVLIPLTPDKHIELLRNSGFKKVEMIFRWYNFACFLGIK